MWTKSVNIPVILTTAWDRSNKTQSEAFLESLVCHEDNFWCPQASSKRPSITFVLLK